MSSDQEAGVSADAASPQAGEHERKREDHENQAAKHVVHEQHARDRPPGAYWVMKPSRMTAPGSCGGE